MDNILYFFTVTLMKICMSNIMKWIFAILVVWFIFNYCFYLIRRFI